MSSSSQPSGSSGHPVSILKITPDHITIDTNAINGILKKVGDQHFVTYSINGPKRTGKSYMLSNCIRYLNHKLSGGRTNLNNSVTSDNTNWIAESVNSTSFTWRGGSNRTTVGIDVWSEPYWITASNGQRIAILLMDTQGSFDAQTTMQQNAIVFAISTLLSSVLMFNIMRDVGEDVLQFFELFSSYATLTLSGPDQDNSRRSGDDNAFQKLIFLIRDFQFVQDYKFGYYDNNQVPVGHTKANFKKEVLDPKPEQPLEVRNVHDQVMSSFKDIGVYLMPTPNKELMQSDQADNLDPEFSQHIGSFVQLIFSNCASLTKKVGGVEVTGKEMMKYVTSWGTLFSGNDLPQIKSIYHTAAQSQYIMAKQAAITFYSKEMRRFLEAHSGGVSDAELMATHKTKVDDARKIYRSRNKMGNDYIHEQFKEEFDADSSELFDHFKSTNKSNAATAQMRKQFEKAKIEFEEQKKNMEKLERRQAEERRKLEEDVAEGLRSNAELKEMMAQHAENQKEVERRYQEKEDKLKKLEEEMERKRKEVMEEDGMGTIGKFIAKTFYKIFHI